MSEPNLSSLRWRIVGALLLVSLLPLLVVSAGAWIVSSRIIEDKARQQQRNVVRNRAHSIERFLGERLRALDLLSRNVSLDSLRRNEALREGLRTLNHSYDNGFVDLGVIDGAGRHLAYVGPYALQDKNYAAEPWFRRVMQSGTYVSDVFLGFRRHPHLIVAVCRRQGDATWVVRATINSEQFERLVRASRRGATGDAFVVNRRGRYQTPSRHGKVLEATSFDVPASHAGVRQRRVALSRGALSQTTTWLNQGRWMLVVQQREAEILAPVYHALTRGALVVLVGVFLIVATTLLATRSLTARIARARRRQQALHNDLVRSARLASLGEMAAGLAHEINNPLAILSAEQTNLEDLLGELSPEVPEVGELKAIIPRCKRQVNRCARITSKMLQFGRAGASDPCRADIAPRLREIVDLMFRQAALQNVELSLEVEPDLPPVVHDHTELEQVLLNLLNNALYATRGGGQIVVAACWHPDEVRVVVTDDGEGIPAEVLERIFLPFYTTKPVGRGTGLGLSVCYGLVEGWGGRIEIESEEGQGTRVTLHLPVEETLTGRSSGQERS